MKKKIKISFLTGIVMLFCFATVYCQQRPSQRSFTSVMNEAKQKQAARNKMLQQIRQTTASNTISSSVSTQNQPVRGSIVVPATTQKTLSSPGTSQQPVNKQINSQPKAAPTVKKELKNF